MTRTEAWAQRVLGWVRSAHWMQALQAIREAPDSAHLNLLEAWLVEHDLLWKLNDHLPKTIARRRQELSLDVGRVRVDAEPG